MFLRKTALMLAGIISISAAAAEVDFNRDVRPILTSNCYQCHGPDDKTRKAKLRLDRENSTREILEDMVEFITSRDPEQIMPPPESGKQLTPVQIETLRQWIAQGALWDEHWSLKPLHRPTVPELTDAGKKWARNPIDQFILAKQNELSLAPSPQADSLTLIRRLTFDLTGLPPTPEQIDTFLKDKSPGAYNKLVNRLLASPHYGERWGRHWLDVVKYADTCGYDKDKLRPNAWPYRDYVIRAFNEDKPYTRFVEEQLAGDALYPNTPDGILGLGFIAAGPWDFIGHVEVPETKIDGRIARNIDRDEMVSNTLNSFTSSTIQCARCHTHKFDPFTQKHYYSLQSVFAAVDRAERPYDINPGTIKKKNELTSRVAELKKQLATLDTQIKKEGGAQVAALDKKIAALKPKAKLKNKSVEFGYHSAIVKEPNQTKWVQVDLGSATNLRRVVLRPCHDDFNNIGGGFGFPVRFKVEGAATADFKNPISIGDETHADFPNPDIAPVGFTTKAKARFIRITATRLAKRSNDYILAISELEALDATGKNVARNAKVSSPDSIEAPKRWRRANLTDGIYPVAGDESAIAQMQEVTRQRQTILTKLDTPERKAKRKQIQTDLAAAQKSLKALPSGKMVYAAATDFKVQGNFKPTKGKPRIVNILHRGNIQDPRGEVRPGTLPIFPGENFEFKLAANHPESARRAALAKWITRKDNPLTWRSIANRIWLWHFGQGIVETPNDFGRMGLPPSHPKLLDWLALEFRDSGGSFKHLHKLIVTSSTYRQSSALSEKFDQIDSDNRLLWRMNRRRLEAEELRDAILATSGTLNLKLGGPGFYLFKLEKTTHSPHYEYHKFDPAETKSHRRSIYRFIARSQPDPFMTTLDCADSSQSTPQRDAERLKKESKTPKGRIRRAHLLTTGRPPTLREMDALNTYAQQHGLTNLCRVLFNLSEFTYLD